MTWFSWHPRGISIWGRGVWPWSPPKRPVDWSLAAFFLRGYIDAGTWDSGAEHVNDDAVAVAVVAGEKEDFGDDEEEEDNDDDDDDDDDDEDEQMLLEWFYASHLHKTPSFWFVVRTVRASRELNPGVRKCA